MLIKMDYNNNDGFKKLICAFIIYDLPNISYKYIIYSSNHKI